MLEIVSNVAKEYFPATLGAVLGAWNKREGSVHVGKLKADKRSKQDVFMVFCIGLMAIIVGICLGKWVSVALLNTYEIKPFLKPIIEFVTALNGIKLVDSVVKTFDKTLDTMVEKVPSIVSGILDVLSERVKKFFK